MFPQQWQKTEDNLSLCFKCCWDWTFFICFNMTCVCCSVINQFCFGFGILDIYALCLRPNKFIPKIKTHSSQVWIILTSTMVFNVRESILNCKFVTTRQDIICLFHSIDISPVQINFGLNQSYWPSQTFNSQVSVLTWFIHAASINPWWSQLSIVA